MKFHLNKNIKKYYLPFSLVHMNHRTHTFYDLTLNCTKEVPEIHTFVTPKIGWNTLFSACSELDIKFGTGATKKTTLKKKMPSKTTMMKTAKVKTTTTKTGMTKIIMTKTTSAKTNTICAFVWSFLLTKT